MTLVTRRQTARPDMPTIASLESLVALSITFGLLFLTVAVTSDSTNYLRNAALGAAGAAAALAALSAAARPASRMSPVSKLALLYFLWTTIQDAVQSGVLKAGPSVIAGILTFSLSRADASGVVQRLRRWVVALVIVVLVPAALGLGFASGRVWFGSFNGRYFGFSNPDALGFLGGIGFVLSVSALRDKWGRLLMYLSGFLLLITATYTSLFASAAALLVYLSLRSRLNTPMAVPFTISVALLMEASVLWVQTEGAIAAFEWLHEHVSLTHRTFIWLELLQLSRGTDYFWLGLGDPRVAVFTEEIYGVGSAHTTLLQMLLSKGILTTTAFILVATAATLGLLKTTAPKCPGSRRIGLAMITFWFVESLVSIQPGTPVGVLLVLLVGASRYRVETDNRPPASRTRGTRATDTFRRSGLG